MISVAKKGLAPTGVLRASINLGNPVLAQGSADDPSGVTVELARELAARLGTPLQLVCFDAARMSLAAVASGAADVGFLAIDPARAELLHFTDPYVVIEGLYAARRDSGIRALGDVDQPGVRVGVKLGSAYDLFLSRSLRQAEVVRGEDGTTVFADQGLEVAAGIRQPLTAYVADHPDMVLLEPAFMEIRQAMAVPASTPEPAVAFLREFVEDAVRSGLVAEALGLAER